MGGGGGQEQQSTTVDTPWSGQQPYLKDAFKEAQGVFDANKLKNNPGYTGDFVAGARPEQTASFQSALDFTNGQGKAANGLGLGVSAGSAGAGLAGTTGAMGGLFDYAGSDATGSTIANAGRYMNNDLINGQIDAALRDPTRQLTEETLPGVNSHAAATGNTNSSRTGVAEGVARRGYEDRAADTAAAIRADAYKTGIGASQADTASQLSALGAAGGLGQGMLSSGLQGIESGIGNQGKMVDQATLAGSMLQAGDQSAIDNELAKYNYEANKDWDNLKNYWGIVGDKDWGGTTTSTMSAQSNPSMMSTLGSGIGILGALFRCDRRVKKDIVRVGRYENGLPMYLFRYKDGDGTAFLGPMAQDVEKVRPDLVFNLDGVKHVHMEALLEA